jgi:hypothetical protein
MIDPRMLLFIAITQKTRFFTPGAFIPTQSSTYADLNGLGLSARSRLPAECDLLFEAVFSGRLIPQGWRMSFVFETSPQGRESYQLQFTRTKRRRVLSLS